VQSATAASIAPGDRIEQSRHPGSGVLMCCRDLATRSPRPQRITKTSFVPLGVLESWWRTVFSNTLLPDTTTLAELGHRNTIPSVQGGDEMSFAVTTRAKSASPVPGRPEVAQSSITEKKPPYTVVIRPRKEH